MAFPHVGLLGGRGRLRSFLRLCELGLGLAESAPGDRVWISIRVGGLGEDGQPQRLATREGGTTAAIVRVLPRGAGIGDLLRKDRKVDPANIVALVIALALLAYYLAT